MATAFFEGYSCLKSFRLIYVYMMVIVPRIKKRGTMKCPPSFRPCFLPSVRHTFVSSIRDTPLDQSTPNLASIFFGTSKSHFFYLGTQSRSRSGFRSTSYTKIGQIMAFHSKFGHIMVTYTSYIYIYPGSTTTQY